MQIAEIITPSNSELLCFSGFTIMQEKNNVCQTGKMHCKSRQFLNSRLLASVSCDLLPLCVETLSARFSQRRKTWIKPPGTLCFSVRGNQEFRLKLLVGAADLWLY